MNAAEIGLKGKPFALDDHPQNHLTQINPIELSVPRRRNRLPFAQPLSLLVTALSLAACGAPASKAHEETAIAAVQTIPRTPDQTITDNEYVYGPLLKDFDITNFITSRGGTLSSYTETVEGVNLTASQIIDRVAHEHSISPKLLIALIQSETGTVDDPTNGDGLKKPFGNLVEYGGLHAGLRSAAAWLDDGYYGLKYRGTTTMHFANNTEAAGPIEKGAGHFAVARFLAMLNADTSDLETKLQAFENAYTNLFGPITEQAMQSHFIPSQPPLLLPWPEEQKWYFTGGPHGAWGIATAWGAVDFAPPTQVGCGGVVPEWVVASAPGVIVRSERGYVIEDTDGDNFEGTGLVAMYLHMAEKSLPEVGTKVNAGDHIGHPSCEGGRATGPHLHFARKYDGEWMPAAGGPMPLELSGWTFEGGPREYDGSMSRPGQAVRNAVTSHRGGRSDIISDNGPTQWAALASAWQLQQVDTVAQVAAQVGPASSTEPPKQETANKTIPACDIPAETSQLIPNEGRPLTALSPERVAVGTITKPVVLTSVLVDATGSAQYVAVRDGDACFFVSVNDIHDQQAEVIK